MPKICDKCRNNFAGETGYFSAPTNNTTIDFCSKKCFDEWKDSYLTKYISEIGEASELRSGIKAIEKLNKDLNNELAEKKNQYSELERKQKEQGIKLFEISDQGGDNLLHYAVKSRNFPLVKTLIEKGVDVNSVNGLKKTPLLLSSFDSEVSSPEGTRMNEISLFLLEKGGNPLASDSFGNTSLHGAAFAGNLPLLQKMTKSNNNLKVTNDSKWTLLHSAISPVQRGIVNKEVIRWLLQQGVDQKALTNTGLSVENILNYEGDIYLKQYQQILAEVKKI